MKLKKENMKIKAKFKRFIKAITLLENNTEI